MDSNEIVTRTNFPESWLWSDIKLPPCPRNTPNWWVTVNHKHIQMKLHLNISQTVNIFLYFSDTTSFVKSVPLQDSITTWQFTGISLSRTHGEDSVTKIWLFLAFPLLFFKNVIIFCIFSLRNLCGWSIWSHCQEGFLHWSQAALFCCPWRADRN